MNWYYGKYWKFFNKKVWVCYFPGGKFSFFTNFKTHYRIFLNPFAFFYYVVLEDK